MHWVTIQVFYFIEASRGIISKLSHILILRFKFFNIFNFKFTSQFKINVFFLNKFKKYDVIFKISLKISKFYKILRKCKKNLGTDPIPSKIKKRSENFLNIIQINQTNKNTPKKNKKWKKDSHDLDAKELNYVYIISHKVIAKSIDDSLNTASQSSQFEANLFLY